MYFSRFKRVILHILHTEEGRFSGILQCNGDFVFQSFFFFIEKKGLSALNLHEIFPVEDYVYSGYDFWYAKLNLAKEKLADLSILPVYYKDLAEDQIRVKKKTI